MKRILLTCISLSIIASTPLHAGTFTPARIAPNWGLDALTRGVSRQQVGRDLFADPYATVTIGSVDVYNVFPYVETRTFQIVSDPRWNRLVYGEMGLTLRAYDGQGLTLGALSNPRGLSVDERNCVYVADAGNDRVIALQANTTYGEIVLEPLFEIRGLSRPFDVSYSDGGTPFVAGDDWLYIAESGRNRVVAYTLTGTNATAREAIGELGSGPGRFAGPMAITTGRANGANTPDVYVADAHTQRIVHLRNEAGVLRWVGDANSDADIVTSLDTDQWGNVYSAAPNRGVVRKFGPDLTPLATLTGGLDRPRSFRVPYFTVLDHRTGTMTREGRPSAISVEQWSDANGMRLWNLGVDVTNLGVVEGDAPAARFMLTDPAGVTLEIQDAANGRVLARQSIGTLAAGAHVVSLRPEDLAATAGANDLVLRVVAASSYPNGATASASTGFRVSGGGVALPSRAMLLGGSPNPVVASTRITFVLPRGAGSGTTLRLYDFAGRVVRRFVEPFGPGRNEVVWDGTGDRGARMPPGVYVVKLHSQDDDFTQRLVLVR